MIGTVESLLMEQFTSTPSQFGRVVKASDLKSDGNFPRRFKPCSWRFSFTQTEEYQRNLIIVDPLEWIHSSPFSTALRQIGHVDSVSNHCEIHSSQNTCLHFSWTGWSKVSIQTGHESSCKDSTETDSPHSYKSLLPHSSYWFRWHDSNHREETSKFQSH